MEGLGIDYILGILDSLIWLLDPARHFLYSAILGSSVFCLTLTILSAFGWVWEHLTHRTMNSGVVWLMIISSLLVGTAFALGLHYVLDYGWAAVSLPFSGAPLELEIP